VAYFNDNEGRKWKIALDAPTIREVRKAFDGLDLADAKGEAYEHLASDPCLLVDVIAFLCRDEIQRASLTERQFGEALIGDAIDGATTALLEAITDFFPQRQRSVMRCLVQQQDQMQTKARDLAMQKITDPTLQQAVTKKLEEAMDAEIRRILTQLDSPTNAPASSESPPADSPLPSFGKWPQQNAEIRGV
jgi:hypothetical protein